MIIKIKKTLFKGSNLLILDEWISDGKFMVRRCVLPPDLAVILSSEEAARTWVPRYTEVLKTDMPDALQGHIDAERPIKLVRSRVEVRTLDFHLVGYSGEGMYRFVQLEYADLLGSVAHLREKDKNGDPMFNEEGTFAVMPINPERNTETFALVKEFMETGGAQ